MKQCKVCAIDFEPKNPKGVYCSKKCKQKDYRIGLYKKIKALEKIANTPASKNVRAKAIKEIIETGQTTIETRKENGNVTIHNVDKSFNAFLSMAKTLNYTDLEVFTQQVWAQKHLTPNQKSAILDRLKNQS